MSFADAIPSLANASLTVTRRLQAAAVLGRSQNPTTSTLTIVASEQPTTGRDLQRLPDGRIDSDVRTVFTKTRLYMGSTETGTENNYLPDLISIGGKSYEVEHVEPFSAHLGDTYYKAICRAVTA